MAQIVSSGQTWLVTSSQIDTGDIVQLGGVEIVSSGGTANGTTIFAGGVMSVTAGGTAASTTISGGTFEILNGGSAGAGTITFAGTGGTLRIDGTTMPTNTISGFVVGDTIDLAGVSFVNGGSVQLGAGNALKLFEDGSTYTLNLDPAQSYT